jgi:hypothetical protein
MPRQSHVDAAALRALLVRQTEEVSADALRNGGTVPEERLDELSRLSRLLEMRDTATSPLRWRWLVPLVAVVTIACLSVLLFVRVSSTEIELELKASDLSFVVPTARVLTGPLTVSSVGVTGLKAIELPGSSLPLAGTGGSTLTFAAEPAGGRPGAISLDPLGVSEGARVSLGKGEGQNRYGVIVQRAASGWGAAASGPLRLVVPGLLNEVRDFSFPRRIGLTPDPRQLSLRFTAADSAGVRRAFRSPLPAAGLTFVRVDQFPTSGSTFAPQVPTIQSGTLYYEAIDGRARPLRRGEGLHLAWSEGEIHDLQLDADGVTIRFHGRVRGMSIGSGESRRSLMPSLLEWLRAQHGPALLWVTTAYVVGAFLSVLGWWRRTA